MHDVSSLLRTLRFIVDHPLNRGRPVATTLRYLRWQLRSRLATAPVVVPFVDDTRLAVTRGMTGATGNIYCGLHELEEMAFVCHALRAGDLFLDGGANVGTFCVLAGGVAGADVIAVEPVPTAFAGLSRNVALNRLEARVQCLQIGLASAPGVLEFSADNDTMNRVVEPGDAPGSTVSVAVRTLDDVVHHRTPTIIKLDVEGYESEVLRGATRALADPALKAMVVEVTRPAEEVTALLEPMGFAPHAYDPHHRRIALLEMPSGGNVLFVRDREWCVSRVRSAPVRVVRANGARL